MFVEINPFIVPMIKNKVGVFILLLLSSVGVWSQTYSVTGLVKDQSSQPVAYANILLLRAQDSSVATGTTSDDNGKFLFQNISKDIYILKTSFIGYTTNELFIDVKSDYNVSDIMLEENIEALNAVEIIARRPTLKREVDRLVFNVEKTALSEGNLMEVLRNTPGVLVLDNAVSVKGMSPDVYINDRKVHLSSDELSDLLEGSSASSIKSVEVITNPPAKYDAQSGVVLNIVMSKSLVTGYNGSVFANYTQGVFPRMNYGMSNYFKTSKVNLFLNYSFNDEKLNRDDEEDINFKNNGATSEIWNSDSNRNIWKDTHSLNMNLDYNINDNNTLSIASNVLFLPKYNYLTKKSTLVSDPSEIPLYNFDSENLSNDKKHNLGFDLDFLHDFGESGSSLRFNSHYTNYNLEKDQAVNSLYYQTDGVLFDETSFNTIANQETDIFTGQVDFSTPLSETSSFETGVKMSNIKSNSKITHFDIVNGQGVLNPDNTDEFAYDETIFAAYMSYSKSWENWELSFGLRAEQTDIEGLSVLDDVKNVQDYLNWFPTLSLSHDISETTGLYGSYKRSIDRPEYNHLNPFRYYLNDNTYVTGNPKLQPVLIDMGALGVTFGSGTYDIAVYYKESKDNIFQLPLQDNANNIIAYTPVNIEKSIEFGIDFITYFDMTARWSVYFVTSFYNIQDQVEIDGIKVDGNQWSNYSILSNNFSFLEDNSLTASLTFTFVGKNIQGLQIVDDRLVSELSLKKTIMGGNGIISLAASDLFNTQNYNIRTQFLDQDNSVFTNIDSRYIKIGFRYKFGNTKLSTNQKDLEKEERDRLNDDD